MIKPLSTGDRQKVPPTASTRAPRTVLFVASAGTFLVLATFTSALTTVLPMARSFGAGVSGRTWTLSSISLGLAVALLSLGAVADNIGRRRVFLVAVGALVAASVLGAAAPSLGVLLAARVLQGIAGAGIIAAGLGLIGQAFPSGQRRTRATAIWGAALGAGIAAGAAAGAAVTDLAGWRFYFGLTALAAAVLTVAARDVPESRHDVTRKLDRPGAALFAGAMATLTAGLTEGRQSFTSPTTLVLLGASVVLLTGFLVTEARTASPMLDLALLREPLFVASGVGALLTGFGLIALMSYLPLMTQQALGQTPLASAGTLALWSVPSMLVATQAHRLPARFGSGARLAAGFVLCAIGVFALVGLHAHDSIARLAPGLIVAGVGSGVANAALGRLAVESVPLDRTAMGSGANNTARYVGGAAGIALVIAIVHTQGKSGASSLLHGWDRAALVSTGECLLAAVIAAVCQGLSRVGTS